jgi:hypothetical protein
MRAWSERPGQVWPVETEYPRRVPNRILSQELCKYYEQIATTADLGEQESGSRHIAEAGGKLLRSAACMGKQKRHTRDGSERHLTREE